MTATLFDPSEFDLRRWPCPRCGGMPVADPQLLPGCHGPPHYLGADPCLGWLPNTVGACCGHGEMWREPYVVVAGGCRPNTPVERLADHVVLHGDEALEFFRSLGVEPP